MALNNNENKEFILLLFNPLITNYPCIGINSASLEDSGVYTCMLESNKDVIAALKLAVLSVRTQDVTITTRATRSIILKCHASVLSYLFNDLGQVWTVNGKIWKDYGASATSWVCINCKYGH